MKANCIVRLPAKVFFVENGMSSERMVLFRVLLVPYFVLDKQMAFKVGPLLVAPPFKREYLLEHDIYTLESEDPINIKMKNRQQAINHFQKDLGWLIAGVWAGANG